MNELANIHAFSGDYSNNNDEAAEAFKSFKAGYQAAMKEAEVLVEALEDYHKAYIFLLRGREHILVAETREALKEFKGE